MLGVRLGFGLGLGLVVRGETCVEAVEREVVRGEAAKPATIKGSG